MKRGVKAQITIFIIIAVVLIGLILVFFLIKTNLNKKIFAPEIERVRLFTENCIKESGSEVVYEIGENGGYYFAPKFSTDSRIAYYYSDGKNYIPPKEGIEKEMSYYIEKRLFFCTRNFVDFPDFEIEQGNIKTKTKILDNKIVLNVEYPLSIIKGENTALIKDFDVKVPIRLGILYNSAQEFIKTSSKDGICLTCLLEISLKNDFYVDMFDYDDETVIFIFRDENSKINDKPFRFVFANKYEVERLEE